LIDGGDDWGVLTTFLCTEQEATTDGAVLMREDGGRDPGIGRKRGKGSVDHRYVRQVYPLSRIARFTSQAREKKIQRVSGGLPDTKGWL